MILLFMAFSRDLGLERTDEEEEAEEDHQDGLWPQCSFVMEPFGGSSIEERRVPTCTGAAAAAAVRSGWVPMTLRRLLRSSAFELRLGLGP